MMKILRRRIGASRVLVMSVPGIGPYRCRDGYVFCYLGTPGGAPWPEMLRWMVDEGKAEDLAEEPYASFIQEMGLPLLTQALFDPSVPERVRPFLAHVDDVLRRFLKSKPKVKVYEEAQERRLLIGIVSTPKDLAEDRQLNYRGYFQDVHHPELAESLRYPGPNARLSETPWRLRRRPPLIGEHNAEVYGEIGLGAEEIADLKRAGVI